MPHTRFQHLTMLLSRLWCWSTVSTPLRSCTRANAEHFTYWDTAIMNIQVLEKLGMCGGGKKVFVLGTSQGGWITVRMALIAPDRISGIIPLGTSMDYESERTRKLGCWDAPTGLTPTINACTT